FSEFDRLLAGSDLRNDRRNNGARRLPRPIRVEGPCDDQWKSERPVKTGCDGVGADLGRAIRRLRLERMRLIDGHVSRRSVYLARRDVNQTLNAGGKRRLANVQCSGDIGIDETGWRPIGVRNRDESGKVESYVDIAEQLQAEVGIADISGDDFDAANAWQGVQPAPVVKRV